MAADVTLILGRTDLFGSVPDRDLAGLAAASRLRGFRRGQVVCTTGDPGDTLIVVITGRIKVAIRSADGGELTLTVIGPSAILGDVSVADGGPRSADAETLEDSQLLLIPREAVQDICGRVPSAAQALARSMATTLRLRTAGMDPGAGQGDNGQATGHARPVRRGVSPGVGQVTPQVSPR